MPLPGGSSTTGYDCDTSVNLALGESGTCTITNDDQRATLIVKKVVINDNGGTKIGSDFSFTVNGGSAIAFLQDTDTLHGKNTLSVNAGTYSVVDDGAPIAGYATSYDNRSNLNIPIGGPYNCTVTGSGVGGGLRLREHRPGCHPHSGLLGNAFPARQHCVVRWDRVWACVPGRCERTGDR